MPYTKEQLEAELARRASARMPVSNKPVVNDIPGMEQAPIQTQSIQPKYTKEQLQAELDRRKSQAAGQWWESGEKKPLSKEEASALVDVGAISPASKEAVKGRLESVADMVIGHKGEIAGGIAGSFIPGAPIVRTLGVGARLASGYLGSVGGGTGGSWLDQHLFKTVPEQPLLTTAAEQATGELAALGVAKGLEKTGLTGAITKYALAKVAPKKFGATEFSTMADNLIQNRKDYDLGPDAPKNIVEAMRNIGADSNLFTAYELTKGRAGYDAMKDLAKEVTRIKGKDARQSAFIAARNEVLGKIEAKIAPKISAGVDSPEVVNGLKASMLTHRRSLEDGLNAIDEKLIPMRSEVKVDVDGIHAGIDKALSDMSQKVGNKRADQIRGIIERYTTVVDAEGNVARKTSMKASDIAAMDAEIKDTLSQYQTGSNVQDAAATLTNKNIIPLFDAAVINQAERDGAGSAADEIVRLTAMKNNLGAEKAALNDSVIGEIFGTGEKAQIEKGLKGGSPSKKLAGSIFKNKQTWEQTKTILEKINPDMIPKLENNFKLRIAREVIPQIDKEVSFKKFEKLIQNHSDMIESIGGKQYLDDLKNVAVVSLGLGQSRGLISAMPGNVAQNDILKTIAPAVLNEINQRAKILNMIVGSGKSFFGFSGIPEEQLMRAAGLGAVEGANADYAMTSYLRDPASYYKYVEVVKNLGRAGYAVANPMSREEYQNAATKLETAQTLGTNSGMLSKAIVLKKQLKEQGYSDEEISNEIIKKMYQGDAQ